MNVNVQDVIRINLGTEVKPERNGNVTHDWDDIINVIDDNLTCTNILQTIAKENIVLRLDQVLGSTLEI